MIASANLARAGADGKEARMQWAASLDGGLGTLSPKHPPLKKPQILRELLPFTADNAELKESLV